jgi:DNA-binding MarR family transcriptional regulator
MKKRKKIMEEIMVDFQAVGNKIQTKVLQSENDSLVTFSQWFVLSIIEQHCNIGIKEISKMLGISSSAITQLVDGLVDKKYVERKDNPKDRRALQLKLSINGKKYIIIKKKEHMKNIVKLFDVFSDKELMILLKLHKKMLFNASSDLL